MKKLFYFIAIASVSTIGFTSCSEDDPIMELPTPNQNPNITVALKLTPSDTFIELGNEVTLKSFVGNTEIKDATYYVDGVAIEGDTYDHGSIANVEIQAKRAGYLDSNIVTVQFAQKPYK